MTERDKMIARYRELAGKKAEHGLTSAEAYELQGLEDDLDRHDEAALLRQA